MKKKEQLVITLSVIVIISTMFGLTIAREDGVPFSEIWIAIYQLQEDVANLQSQINDVEQISGSTRIIIEGYFDINQDGDLVLYGDDPLMQYAYQWKRIEVPQLSLADMPSIQVFLKSNEEEPFNLFRNADAGATFGSMVEDTGAVLYDERCIYVFYKVVIGTDSPYSLCKTTGDYKIIIVK